jgi:hypothetical protein
VDYRLAQYRRRRDTSASSEGFTCRVLWNQRDPILKLPDRRQASVPEGETAVRVADGSVWLFRFAKEYCNVARPVGTDRNQLPDLLRSWFGPKAGHPGTAFDVRFTASPDGLWVEPAQAEVVDLLPLLGIPAYPDLRAAAGAPAGDEEAPDVDRVWLPIEGAQPGQFAVRVTGTSMDGGSAPLRDGDWGIFRFARGVPLDALVNRVALVQLPAPGAGYRYVIKRLVRRDARWQLVSDNPDGPTVDVDDATPIARLERGIHPEALAPALGARLDDPATSFGLPDLQPTSGRYRGHLFVFVAGPGQLLATDRVAPPLPPRPGETAYVLAKTGVGWRYLGVGRQQADEIGLAIPEVDFATWRAYGHGREASRPLPEGVLERAQRLVDALVAERPTLRRVNGSTARILGTAARGGLRIDGGEGGFGERTVSLTDLAWVVAAAEDVRASGGILDEARVNRLRYLEGTPKESTRWIDTGWAIAAWDAGAERADVVVPVAPSVPQRLRRADGSEVDATYRVERKDGQTSIVFEARGGTKGTSSAQNTEYGEGLRLLLEKLAAEGAVITDAAVESRATAELTLEERRLDLGEPYPVAIGDAEELRRRIGKAQERIGRAPEARGGNATKRIRLWLPGNPGV